MKMHSLGKWLVPLVKIALAFCSSDCILAPSDQLLTLVRDNSCLALRCSLAFGFFQNYFNFLQLLFFGLRLGILIVELIFEVLIFKQILAVQPQALDCHLALRLLHFLDGFPLVEEFQQVILQSELQELNFTLKGFCLCVAIGRSIMAFMWRKLLRRLVKWCRFFFCNAH